MGQSCEGARVSFVSGKHFALFYLNLKEEM